MFNEISPHGAKAPDLHRLIGNLIMRLVQFLSAVITSFSLLDLAQAAEKKPFSQESFSPHKLQMNRL